MSARYLTAVETAKLLRAELKREFPGVKFSVRTDTYSGGASIDVHWLDGPTEQQVSAVANRFTGSDFDGTIDMASSRYHWLTPQGEIYVAKVQGTVGSRGVIAPEQYVRPHDDAELVHLGADFIFTHRNYSRRMLERGARWAMERYGEAPEIIESESWDGKGKEYRYEETRPADPYRYGNNGDSLATAIMREIQDQPGPRWNKIRP